MDIVADVVNLSTHASVIICISKRETLYTRLDANVSLIDRKRRISGEMIKINNQKVMFKEINIYELYNRGRITSRRNVTPDALKVFNTKITELNPWVNSGSLAVLIVTLPGNGDDDYWRTFAQCVANYQSMSFVSDQGITLDRRKQLILSLGQFRSLQYSQEPAAGSAPYGSFSNAYRMALMAHAYHCMHVDRFIIVGFHPIFAKFAINLKSNMVWIEKGEASSLINKLNEIALNQRPVAAPPEPRVFQKPSGDDKLEFLATAMVYKYNCIIYIGAYPGKYFQGLSADIIGYKDIYLIDPDFEDETFYDGVTVISGEWDFNTTITANLKRFNIDYSRHGADSTVIVDDSWVPDGMKQLMIKKVYHFKELSTLGIHGVVKFNMYGDLNQVVIPNLDSILWVPFTNDSNESRLLLSRSGKVVTIFRNPYLQACAEWRREPYRNQIYMAGRELYKNNITVADVFDIDLADFKGVALIAPFALTNRVNASNSIELMRKLNKLGAMCDKANVPFYCDIIISERLRSVYNNTRPDRARFMISGDTLHSVADGHSYTDIHIPLWLTFSSHVLCEVPVYSLVNDVLMAGGKVLGYHVMNPSSDHNRCHTNRLRLAHDIRATMITHKMSSRFRVQDIRSSLGYRLKNLTATERSLGYHSISSTYVDRCNILASVLIATDPPNSIVLTPFEERPVQVLKDCDATFLAPWGPTIKLALSRGYYDISGHLLNLLAHSMYEPTSLKLWMTQAFANYSMVRKINDWVRLSQQYDEALQQGLIVETSREDIHAIWHKWADYLFAILVAKEYLSRICPPQYYDNNEEANTLVDKTLQSLWAMFFIH